MLKAVIFDMDGVIVDSEPLHQKAYYAMFSEIGISVSDKRYDTLRGKSTIEVCQQLIQEFGLNKAPEDMVAIKRQHFDVIFKTDKTFGLIGGVRDLIEDYHNHGVTLILASSASMVTIDRIFNRFGLNPFFKAKLSGADLKASKPHPEIFIKAAEATGVSREECMVIEDATNGIEAAKAAGLFCVGYDGQHSKNQDYTRADLVISDFEEIRYDLIKAVFEQ